MEHIRYLQPATFPPPACTYSEDKFVLHKNERIDDHSNSNNSNKNKLTCTSGRSNTHNAHNNQKSHKQSHQEQSYRFYQNHYSSLLYLVFVILISCNQATIASPVFADNPSLAQFQSGRNIRHLPCIVRKSGLSGTCMFAIDCIKQNGTHLGTCIDRFYFGSCCQIKDETLQFAPEISDNSIDQNTILHFEPEATTLPTSGLYKTTTESQQHLTSISNITHAKQPTTQIKVNHTSTTSKITSSTNNLNLTKPTKVTTLSAQQTRKPIGNSNYHTTHKTSHFVVRTTRKPATTAKTTTPKTTSTTTTTTTAQPITTTAQTTRKPSRRKPTTTTTPAPVLTTDGPKIPSSILEDLLQPNTTPPQKLFTFQMVETTTPTSTESTNFIEYTTFQPPTLHTKRPHRPTTQKPTTEEHKTAAVTSIITTIETSTSKVKPSSSSHHTKKPKPKPITTTKLPITTIISTIPPQTIQTTQKTRKPTPPKKTTTKRPKPTTKPGIQYTKPITDFTTTRPVPLADEIPTTIIMQQKPITTAASHVHTTHPQTTRPKPIATVTKVPASTIITSTIMSHRKPAPETTNATKKPKPKPTTTSTTTAKPLTTTKKTTTTTTTTSTPPPTKATAATTTSTTFKPGLITWTSEGAEPTVNATSASEQQPAQWLPVSTIAPVTIPSEKHEATTAAPTTIASTTQTTKKTSTTSSPIIMGSTEKIIVSISSSVSEVQKNETKQPPRPSPIPSPSPPSSPPTPTPTQPPSSQKPSPTTTSKLPTVPVKPILSTTTSTPLDVESSTLDYESSFESSTDLNWGSATTGSMVDGITEDYNATMLDTPTATTLPPTPANSLEGVDYRQICGRRMFPEPRIVGGSNAAFGRWPWQISLRQWRTSTYLHKCGAALLNENWAITAAHCVDNVPPSDLLLRLGEYDLAEEEEPYGYQERRVQIVASHPQFDPRTFEYDLALLRFYEPVVFQPNIIPVCVPNSDEDFIGQTAFVTGWGRLYEDGPLPSVLQEVAVPVINNTICETMYRAAGYIEHIPHIFICAGWKKGGYDSCEGDSGGPMVLQREDDKRFQLGGVISWGIGCAEANQPGVYTRISEFRDWINQILQF